MLLATLTPNNYYQPWEATKCFLKAAREYDIVTASGPYIYANRNELLKKAREKKDSVLMIDSDIVFSLHAIKTIEEHLKTLDTVTGVYCLGISPYPPVIMKRGIDTFTFVPPPAKLAEIDACGGGFLGISAKVVQEMPELAFNSIWEKEQHGEDISFCIRLKEKGFKLWCDPNLRLGQVRSQIIYPN